MTTMSPDEARDILAKLGWSQTMLWQAAGRDDSTTRKQLRGKEPIDPALAAWLRALYRLRKHPAVAEWQQLLNTPPARITREAA